jgi:hypothetical protein
VRDRRLATLRAALGFLQFPPRAPGVARIIIGLCLVFQVACSPRTDVRRVPSPGYSLDAVLVELNYGATSSFSYEIHIVPRGRASSSGDLVVKIWSGCGEQIGMEWQRANLLVVTCQQEARFSDFTNRWLGIDAEGSRRAVEIRLTSPSGTSPSLPQRDFYSARATTSPRTQYGNGNSRATFYVTGLAHSIVGGAAWEPTAWGAVQVAAWMACPRAT